MAFVTIVVCVQLLLVSNQIVGDPAAPLPVSKAWPTQHTPALVGQLGGNDASINHKHQP
jgi:hypothetical protein